MLSYLGRFCILTLFVCLSACASTPQKISNTGNVLTDQLNQGYSILYKGTSGLKHSSKIFYLKRANSETREVVASISSYAARLSDELESLERQFPSINLGLDPLPDFEKARQSAATKQLLLNLAPIIGRTGANFERTLLLSLAGGVNQLRYMAMILSDEEQNAERKEHMAEASEEFLLLYKMTLKLLNEKYYTHNTYDPAEFDS